MNERNEDHKRRSEQWQKSVTSDFHHRNLEESFPDCNETLFQFEIEFHPDFQTETSWDLVDTATNTTIVEKKLQTLLKSKNKMKHSV